MEANNLQIETQLLTNLASHNYSLFQRYYNDPKSKVSQSSIAIIFRATAAPNWREEYSQYSLQKQEYLQMFGNKFPPNKLPIENLKSLNLTNLEIIFIQRSSNPKDVHSGQIAFPGGKCEDNEYDFEAAIRETIEEVGLNLYDKKLTTFYLKQIDRNVYVRKTSRGESLFCTYHCFLLIDQQRLTDHLKISEAEVQDFKWVPFRLFYKYMDNIHFQRPDPKVYLYKDETINQLSLPFTQKIGKKINEMAMKNYDYSIYPKMNIEMKTPLFGLSFYFVANIFSIMLYNQPELLHLQAEGLVDIKTLAKVANFKFKDKFVFGKLISMIIGVDIVKSGITESYLHIYLMVVVFSIFFTAMIRARL